MLRASLKELYSPEKITVVLEAINLPKEARPENLSLDQFVQLFELLNINL